MKIPQVVCYGIEIKTNTPIQETKGEPQANGSYNIRKIILKIMEYTHKPKSNSRLTQRTKEIKNYIYQLITKVTKAQTGKQS